MARAEYSSGYDSMMKGIEDAIQARDRDSDTNLRELLNTRRKVWDLYPRVGALEDSLMRVGGQDSDEIAKLLNEYRGVPSHPAGSSAGLVHGASNPGRPASSYSARRPPTSASSSYRKKEYDFEKPSAGGYKPRKRAEAKWDTQSMVNIPSGKTSYSKPRVPYTPSYRSTGYTRRPKTDDFETSSVRSYSYSARPRMDNFETSSVRSYQDDDDLRSNPYPARKTYEDWSPPRYSPRAPLNAYIYEPDLTTSYQSPRTLVDRDDLGLVDDDDSDIILSTYSRVPLTETAVRRHNQEMSYPPYRRYYDDSSVAGSYTGYYNPASNPHKFETRSYTPETGSFKPVSSYHNPRRAGNPGRYDSRYYTPASSTHKFETSSYTPATGSYKPYKPVTKSTAKYDTMPRYRPTTPTTTTKARKATAYQEKPIGTTYGRPVTARKDYKPAKASKSKVTFAPMPTPTTSTRKRYESTARSYDTLDTKPPRHPTTSRYDADRISDTTRTESRRQTTADKYYDAPRGYTHAGGVHRGRPSSASSVGPTEFSRDTQLQKPLYGGHFRLGIYKGDPKYYMKHEAAPAEDITLSHLFNILNAQTKVLSECVGKL